MPRTDEVLKRLEKLHPKIIDLSLGRILNLLAKLGNPHDCLPLVIHVAGTNGKGSTVAFMRAILEHKGFKVHTYTSPHLVRFNERIRINGSLIDEAELLELLEEVEAVNQNEPITLFEITTAVAMVAFARKKADVLLLETGLGGRVDATNVVAKPAVTILTPIAMDHESYLGDTLEKIAGEKIPIIKPKAKAVIARQEKNIDKLIISHCQKVGAELFRCGYEWFYEITENGFDYQSKEQKLSLPLPVLRGNHQVHNASVAIAALEALADYDNKFAVSSYDIAQGISNAKWLARLQRIERGRLLNLISSKTTLWLDGGHNPSAGEVLNEFWQGKEVYVIMAMLKTKDAKGFLSYLTKFAKKFFITEIPNNENSTPALELLEITKKLGFNDVVICDDYKDALKLCSEKNKEPANILICGSLYLAGKVLEENAT